MHSKYFVVITCCLFLSQALQIFAFPTPLPSAVDSNLADDLNSASEELKGNLPITAAPNRDEKPTTSDEPEQHTTAEPATTSEEPTTETMASTTEEHATIASTKPTVICKDLEINSSYHCLLGDIPFKTGNNTRVHPINGIKIPRKSCKELYADGYRQSGIYIIKPRKTEVTVFCDMSLIGKGGWTIIQRRLNNSDIFNDKLYRDYQDGFGDLSSSFWLGLDTIHDLTSSCDTEVYIGLEWFVRGQSTVFVARYRKFCVGNEASGYTLKVSGHRHFTDFGLDGAQCLTGGQWEALNHYVYDALTQHNGTKFFTSDKDNEKGCAQRSGGGWWYTNCYVSNLNGHDFRWTTYYPNNNLLNSVIAIR